MLGVDFRLAGLLIKFARLIDGLFVVRRCVVHTSSVSAGVHKMCMDSAQAHTVVRIYLLSDILLRRTIIKLHCPRCLDSEERGADGEVGSGLAFWASYFRHAQRAPIPRAPCAARLSRVVLAISRHFCCLLLSSLVSSLLDFPLLSISSQWQALAVQSSPGRVWQTPLPGMSTRRRHIRPPSSPLLPPFLPM